MSGPDWGLPRKITMPSRHDGARQALRELGRNLDAVRLYLRRPERGGEKDRNHRQRKTIQPLKPRPLAGEVLMAQALAVVMRSRAVSIASAGIIRDHSSRTLCRLRDLIIAAISEDLLPKAEQHREGDDG